MQPISNDLDGATQETTYFFTLSIPTVDLEILSNGEDFDAFVVSFSQFLIASLTSIVNNPDVQEGVFFCYPMCRENKHL